MMDSDSGGLGDFGDLLLDLRWIYTTIMVEREFILKLNLIRKSLVNVEGKVNGAAFKIFGGNFYSCSFFGA